MTLIHGLFILAVLGWLCAAGALWHARRRQEPCSQMQVVQPTEVELRLQQVTNVPAPTNRYVPGNSTTRPLSKRLNRLIGERV